MSRGPQAEPSGTGSPGIDLVVRENRAWLAERGELVVGSGSFCAGPYSGSIHCDFGPPTQDKNANQDYALAWRPTADGERRLPRLVLALADGLTNSFRSEWAAAAACWVAVRVVVEGSRTAAPQELARFAFNEAGHTIVRAAEEFSRDPETSCPEGQFLSTWKYILKKGGLLQTTLTLAWIDADHFNLAIIGDGGALWRGYARPTAEKVAFRSAKEAALSRSERRQSDRVLAACNLESQQVHALGPADPFVHEFDHWRQERCAGPFVCALMTDGIGRGIGANSLRLLDDLEAYDAAGSVNSAREFIARSVRERPKDFDDNLTLAIVRREQT
jgi:serine/threonine protein phosphatase PrpC